jgi:hypothetical protein
MTEAQAPAASQRQAERKRRRAARFAMAMLSCARSKTVSSRAMRETCGSRSRRRAAARSTGNRDHLHVRFDERRVPFRSTEASPASGDPLGASMERKLPSHCLCGAAPKRTAHAEMEALMKRSIGLSHALSGAMALCIACPVPEVTAAAAFLAATFTAHAQDTEVRRPPRKTRVTHDLRLHHRKRAEPAPSDSEGASEAIRRLPDFFPNCEHPAPRWCNDNY